MTIPRPESISARARSLRLPRARVRAVVRMLALALPLALLPGPGERAEAQSVWVNYDLLLKIDGSKFFPIGLLELGVDRYPDDWNARIRASGANLVWDNGLMWTGSFITCEAARDSAEAAGYRLLVGSQSSFAWDDLGTPELEVGAPMYAPDSLETMLDCLDQSDRLISLSNRDEPGWSLYRGVLGDMDSLHIVETFGQLRDASPHRVVSMNFAPVHPSEDLQTWMDDIEGWLGATQVVMFASYPYPAGPGTCNPINVVGWPDCPMDRLPDSIDLFLNEMNRPGQPLWTVIQAFKGIPLKEMRWEAHVSVIHRATGVLWAGWTWYHPLGDGSAIWPTTEQVISEMAALHPVLVRPDRDGIESLHPDLEVRGKRTPNDGETVIFAASRRGASGPMAIDVGGLDGDWAEVLWEYRFVPIVDGVIEDEFDEYESHVYRIESGLLPPTAAPEVAVTGDEMLLRVFPNPSTDETRAWFRRPDEATAVEFAVYDVSGRLVARPLTSNGPGRDGRVVWDGRDESGRSVGPGLYFLRGAAADGRTATARVVRR